MSATYPKCQRNLFTPVYRKRIAERIAMALGGSFQSSSLSFSNSDLRNWVTRGVPADMDCELITKILDGLKPGLFRDAQSVPLEGLQMKVEGEVIEVPEVEEEISFEDIQELMNRFQSFGDEVVRVNATLRRDLDRVIKANADLAARIYEIEEDLKRVDSRINAVKVVFPSGD